MTILAPPHGYWLPAWPIDIVRNGSLTFAGELIDATGEYFEFIGHVGGQPYTGTKTVAYVHWRTGLSNAVGHTIRVSMDELDTATGPPARSDGADDSYGDETSPAASTGFRTAMSNGTPKVLAWGDFCAVRIRLTAITSGQIGIAFLMALPSGGYTEAWMTRNVGTPDARAGVPIVMLEFTDGSFAILHTGIPTLTASQEEAFSTSTGGTGLGTGNRRALRWTPPTPVWCSGARVYIYVNLPGANFDVKLYRGTTEIASVSIDGNWPQVTSAYRLLQVVWPPVLMQAGQPHYLALVPSTTTNIRTQTLDFSDVAHINTFAEGFGYDCWDNSSAWQNPTDSNKRLLYASFRLHQFETPGFRGRPAILRGR